MGSLLVTATDMMEIVLTRVSCSQSWGFTLSGGADQGLLLKVGCVLEDSVAERSGLRSRDLIRTINGKEVYSETHAACVTLVKNAGTRLVLSVERGNQIKISNHATNQDSSVKEGRSGRAYYIAAMKEHGLSGKIPTTFTTCGKPHFESLQYNSPIEIYGEETVDEMVKVMEVKTSGSIVSSKGWTVHTYNHGKDSSTVENKE